MGGFTQVFLKDCSQENIDEQNKRLKEFKVRKGIRFYSEKDIELEYHYFKLNDGYFPESQFPRDKIKSYKDFKKYWSTEALGAVFVPPIGTLQFDCYFGRTSNYAMRNIGKYMANNPSIFKKTDGSFSTFMERGMTKLERQIMKEYNLD